MGQAKRNRTTQVKLEDANRRLNETTLEMLRRDRENREAEARFETEDTTSEPETQS